MNPDLRYQILFNGSVLAAFKHESDCRFCLEAMQDAFEEDGLIMFICAPLPTGGVEFTEEPRKG